jgi:segregation and condensation protein B
LIKIVGRKDTLGRPLLYGTTDNFLKRFGLTDINSLPDYDELLEKIQIIHAAEENLDLYDSNR